MQKGAVSTLQQPRDESENRKGLSYPRSLGFPGVSAGLKSHMPVQETETWVQSLGQEDSVKKEMATHSSILAWEIPWTEEPGGL